MLVGLSRLHRSFSRFATSLKFASLVLLAKLRSPISVIQMYTFIFNFCNCLSRVFFRDFFRDFFGDLVCGVKEIVQMSKDVVEVDSKSRSY